MYDLIWSSVFYCMLFIVTGPEPKSLAMFSVCNDRYWFVVVGMQVPGGLAVWSIDITEANPFFTFQAIHQEVILLLLQYYYYY